MGHVSGAVAGFSLTNSNYDYLTNTFEGTFGQPNKIISAHVQALLDLLISHFTTPWNIMSGDCNLLDDLIRLMEISLTQLF